LIVIMTEKQSVENHKYQGGDQPHFFPVVFDPKTFEAEMEKRGIPCVGI